MQVYMLTNRVTRKAYVGATTISLARRFGCHRQDAKKGRTSLIAQAIREFGWSSFDVAVIATSNKRHELLELEADAIKKLNTLHPHGYNRSSFDSHEWKWFNAEKRRQSIRCMGRTPWNKGKKCGPLPASTKQKLSASLKGRPTWNKGIPATLEVRAKLSAMRMGGNNGKARAIEFEGIIYPSIADARRATGLTHMQMKYRLYKGIARYVQSGD